MQSKEQTDMRQNIRDRMEKIKEGIVPKGYKKTKVGIIPEEWEVRRFKDIVIKSNEKYYPNKDHFNYKCIELEHIISGTGIINGFTNSNNVKSTKNKFNRGEVLYGRLRPYLKKYYYTDFSGVCSTEIWVFKVKGSQLNSKFIYYIIQSNYFNYKANVSTGSSMPRADWNYVSNVQLAIPPIHEQQKIADILSTWDRAIALKESLIKEKEKQKKGLLNILFDYSESSGGEFFSLGKVLRLEGGFAFKSLEFKDSGIPVIRISNIQDNGINLSTDIVYHNKIDLDKKFYVNQGDILIAMSGATTGKIAVYKSPNLAYLNQRVGKFVPDESKIINTFLYQLLKTQLFRKQLRARLVAGAQPNISSSDIESLKFYLPPLSEQKRIAAILSTADKEIELLKEEVALLKEQKKGLMQLLLTGIVRVKEDAHA